MDLRPEVRLAFNRYNTEKEREKKEAMKPKHNSTTFHNNLRGVEDEFAE